MKNGVSKNMRKKTPFILLAHYFRINKIDYIIRCKNALSKKKKVLES